MGTVKIENGKILIDGKEELIRSGAMHYFRIHPDYWRDRIVKLRNCGLNTLETYLAWNVHEAVEGQFQFDGWADFPRFIRIAAEEGLKVIVRPGPYICSEWDLGGLPAWLLDKPGIRLRCSNAPFLEAAGRYLNEVLKLLRPLQFTEGGPVIMMQIENEYGGYGSDRAYLCRLKEMFEKAGITVPLFTSDGSWPICLEMGTLPDVMATVNNRNHPVAMVKTLLEWRPGAVPFITELWNGGALHWEKPRPIHAVEDVRADIREALENRIHFNLYMFHGGTNFGFMNGANLLDGTGVYSPMLTSYEVDAPLSEAGDPTPKYFAIRDEIRRHFPELKLEEPVILPKKAYGRIELSRMITLGEALPCIARAHREPYPQTMEHYKQNVGYILYRFRVNFPGRHPVVLKELRDRAVILVDGKFIDTVYRNDRSFSRDVVIPPGGATLDILVENVGRLNGGSEMNHERKGLGAVLLYSAVELSDCEVFSLPMDNLENLSWGEVDPACNIPAFYRGEFEIPDEPCDTFLRVPAGIRGFAVLNGFNLGRYWQVGPQRTLYVPAPLLRRGRNEVILFEQHGLTRPEVEFTDVPDLGPGRQMVY